MCLLSHSRAMSRAGPLIPWPIPCSFHLSPLSVHGSQCSSPHPGAPPLRPASEHSGLHLTESPTQPLPAPGPRQHIPVLLSLALGLSTTGRPKGSWYHPSQPLALLCSGPSLDQKPPELCLCEASVQRTAHPTSQGHPSVRTTNARLPQHPCFPGAKPEAHRGEGHCPAQGPRRPRPCCFPADLGAGGSGLGTGA